MSREEKDRDYKPNKKIVRSSHESRRTRRVETVDYSEAESDTEGELTLSEGTTEGDITIKDEQQSEREKEWDLQNLWTPSTLESNLDNIGRQYMRISMAHKSEMSSLEKMMGMMIQMKQDDQRREGDREDRREREDRERLEREDTREREDREREAKREETQYLWLN